MIFIVLLLAKVIAKEESNAISDFLFHERWVVFDRDAQLSAENIRNLVIFVEIPLQ